MKPLFETGRLVSTPGVLNKFGEDILVKSLIQHLQGDSDMCREDKKANREAIKNNTRVFSAYELLEGKLWIITEWDRSVTTFLLPEEY